MIDDEFLKNKIDSIYLLTDSQDNLVPLYSIAQSILFADFENDIKSIKLLGFFEGSSKVLSE